MFPEGLQLGSSVALETGVEDGAGGEVAVAVGGGPLVAVCVTVGGTVVAVRVRVEVGVVDAVDVAEEVCVEVEV